MRHAIFLLSAIFLLVGCSNNDNDTVQEEEQQIAEVKIKRLVERNETNNYQTFVYFNEDGTINKQVSTLFNGDESSSSYNLLEYDTGNRLTSIKLYSSTGNYIENKIDFMYDSQGRIVSRVAKSGSGQGYLTTSFTYDGNKISFSEEITNKSGYIIFDDQGRIIETQHDKYGNGDFRHHYLSYENNELKEIQDFYSTIYRYTLESTVNPLYRNFINNPLQYMLESQYIYDIDFTIEDELFANNVSNMTKIINGQPIINSRTTTFTYNDENLPISANTIRDGDVSITKTYEYY